MIVDQISSLSGDPVDEFAESLILHIGRTPAARTDQVMVVIWSAGDVCMLPRGQVESL